MNLGDTFHLLEHLWVVVSNPTADGSIAMVNFTTLRRPCDETCVLNAGDHPFIRHPTIVAYGRGRMSPLNAHAAIQRQPRDERVRRRVLDRIMRGAIQSEATPPRVLRAIQDTLATRW